MSELYLSELPLPGGVCQYFETLMALLRRVGEKPLTNNDLFDVFEGFGASGQAAVNGYTGLIARMGFWTTKDGIVRLTPEGIGLIEQTSSNPVAAKETVLGIKLRDVAGYREMLRLLSQGECPLNVLNDHVKAELGTDWTSKNQIGFRTAWLRSLDYLELDGQKYRLTDIGYSMTATLALNARLSTPTAITISESSPIPPTRNTGIVARAISIGERLDQTAVAGGNGVEFEKVTEEAFRFLGFTTQLMGGSGKPDVVLTAPLGKSTYRVLIDSKSRTDGKVQQNDIHFDVLRQHKSLEKADYSMVIGKDFAGGNLATFAKDNNVRLLATDDLRQLLEAHAEGVIGLDRLEKLFQGHGPTNESVLLSLAAESAHTVQAMSLAKSIYNSVLSRQGKEGKLDSHSLFYILGHEFPLASIQETITLLTSGLFGVLGKSSDESLYARISPETFDNKLDQIRQRLGK